MNSTLLMTNYKTIMNQLLFEKPDKTSEQIEIKINKTKELAKTLFAAVGDELFIENVKNNISALCETRPGRCLIKELSKLILSPIEIQKSESVSGFSDYFLMSEGTDDIAIYVSDVKTREYHTIFDENLPGEQFPTSKKAECPAFVTLAHEMIHLLHFKLDKTKFDNRLENSGRSIFPFMDSREEQLTITGIDEQFLTKKMHRGQLKKSDILCENAFLLALHLAPRNCHREVARYNQNKKNEESGELHCAYYAWLEANLYSINNIPEDKKTDKEFIKKFTETYPRALQTIDDSLKMDRDFFIDLVQYNKYAIKHLPRELLSDKDFLNLLVNKNNVNYFFLPKDLRINNPDLALLVIKARPSWYSRLDKELQESLSVQ